MQDQAMIHSDDLSPLVVDAKLAFERRLVQEGCQYWMSCRADRAMPARADIRPEKISHLLTYVALIDIRPQYRVRLAGAGIESIFGSMSRKPLPAFLPPDLLERWEFMFATTIRSAAAMRFASRIELRSRTYLRYEVLVAPLADDGRTPDMLFCVLETWPDFDEPVSGASARRRSELRQRDAR